MKLSLIQTDFVVNSFFRAFGRAFRSNLFALEKSKKDFHFNP